MARFHDDTETCSEGRKEPDAGTVVYCQMFGDMVIDAVCALRRQILTSEEGFSCTGCIMNIALDGVDTEGPPGPS